MKTVQIRAANLITAKAAAPRPPRFPLSNHTIHARSPEAPDLHTLMPLRCISLLLLLAASAALAASVPSVLQQCIVQASPRVDLILPSDGDTYDDMRLGLDTRIDMSFPDLIVSVRTELDIIASVRCAATSGAYISVRSLVFTLGIAHAWISSIVALLSL